MIKKDKLWIGGEWVKADTGKDFGVINPTTGEEIGRVPLAGLSDVDKAVEAAGKAFPIWSRRPQSERSAIIAQLAALMRENADELIRLEVEEHGTPLEGAPFMVDLASGLVEYAASASRTLMGDVIQTLPDTVTYLKREPAGVCALITPWNVPLMMMAAKLGPALAVGNTCVIKPPRINSLMGIKFAEILSRLDLPAGAVNVITGPGEGIGSALASHPGVDLIGFTGSTETGKAIMSAASSTIKRLVMELGGKNPVIVLEDADLDRAMEILCHYTYINGGQNCAAPGRIYVHDSIYDEFIERFLETSRHIVVGDPSNPETNMGPMASAEHRDSVERYIQSGIDEGARLVLGGKRPTDPPLDKGFFVMPTVFADVRQDMKIAREEIFGPVACIMKFSSDDEVIQMANDSNYGLCASVWTRDTVKGLRFIDQLRVGTAWINHHMNLNSEWPWGGYKESGLGKESGVLGMQEFTELKLVCFELTN